MENDSWLVEEGDTIVQKQSSGDELTAREKLIYCLWVADYSMRNADDLESAKDLYSDFLTEGHRLAKELKLPNTLELFSKDETEFEEVFFDMFDRVCEELRSP